MNQISAQTQQLVTLLLEANLTIAVAESLTAGALAAELVCVPGASGTLQGGLVAYQNSIKREVLGVDAGLLERSGPVHPEVAKQMAVNVRRIFSVSGEHPVDIGVSTTGVAGPESADGNSAGVAFVGIDSIFGQFVVKLDNTNLVRVDDPIGSRHRVRLAVVEAGIFNLLEHLIGFKPV